MSNIKIIKVGRKTFIGLKAQIAAFPNAYQIFDLKGVWYGHWMNVTKFVKAIRSGGPEVEPIQGVTARFSYSLIVNNPCERNARKG